MRTQTYWALVMVCLLTMGGRAQTAAPDIASKVDEYMNAALQQGRFSGVILLARKGQVLVSKGYGMADYEARLALTPQTKFRLASVTKQFTALGILLLQERGKLNVRDSVCKYVAACPAAWEPISIHHLLTHTAGLTELTALPDYPAKKQLRTSVSDLIARFQNLPLEFQPGEKFRYSNSGYALLGHLIERVSGQTYQAFLQANIFSPLGMNASGYDPSGAILQQCAQSYEQTGEKLARVEQPHISVSYAAGGLYSTAEDLLRWNQALATGKLLSAPSWAAMTTPFKEHYAYGLTVDEEFDRRHISHSGNAAGFATWLGSYPSENLTVVVLSNLAGAPVPFIARDLAAMVLGEKYDVPVAHTEIKVDPAVYEAYVGAYERQPGRNFNVYVEQNRLYLAYEGRPTIELHPESPSQFFVKEVNIQFTFVREARQVTHLILHQNGEHISVKKLRAAPAQALQATGLIAEANRAVAATRGGSAQAFQITSAILKETRKVLIVLPASYAQSAPTRKYPTIVVVDGESLIAPVAAVSDELSRQGQIPEAVIVAIENAGDNRKRVYDLTPPGLSVSGSGLKEGGELFLDFIEKELLPAVDQQFRTAAPRTFVGHSSGGILATYVAATRATYRAIVAIDTPTHLGDDWLVKKLLARAQAAPTPLRYVSLEARLGWSDQNWRALTAAAPATWRLAREQFKPKESHESMLMLSAYLGLREAFGDYSILAAPVSPTTSTLAHYAKVSASLGATLIPPRRLLRNVVEDLLMEGRGALAREAYDTLAAGYGAPAGSTQLLAQIVEVERRPPPTETVEGLLATPFPTPAEAQAFIGEWVGVQRFTAEAPPVKFLLRLKVVDGRLVGENVNLSEDDQEVFVQRWEYLKITPVGMTWGFMNGMRPRGVILFEGKLENGTLSGQSRFGGINFQRPDGMPEPTFTFRRAK